MKITFKDSNSSKNILYLGTGDTFNYLLDKDMNALISKDEFLYKNVCMGKETPYIDNLMQLLNKGTFNNKVHRKSMQKDIKISSEIIDFKEAFCYVTFPKVIQIVNKDKNETILLMGINKEHNRNWFGIKTDNIKDKNTSYFYSETQIQNVLENNITLQKNLNNPELWVQDIMLTEALKKEPYQELENAHFIEIEDINLSKEFL